MIRQLDSPKSPIRHTPRQDQRFMQRLQQSIRLVRSRDGRDGAPPAPPPVVAAAPATHEPSGWDGDATTSLYR